MEAHVYQDLKKRALLVSKDDKLRDRLLKELARIVVAELRFLGLSERGLCIWAGYSEFGSAQDEIAQVVAKTAYDSLMSQMWALARRAGVRHETRKGVFSPELSKAVRLAAWTTAREFRETFEKAKREALPKEKDVLFYIPLIDQLPQTNGRWV